MRAKYPTAFLFTCIALLVFTGCSRSEKEYTQYVNPLIGTDGTGHCFPGPSCPFGMVQPGPDNRDHGWDYTSGYQYRDSVIMGFSQTRANGTGIGEFGDVLLQPVSDNRKDNFSCSYVKSSERSAPGFYTVSLSNGVKVSLTCSERVAFHEYTYPAKEAQLLVDLQHGIRFLTDSLVLDSKVQMPDHQTLVGYCHTRNWVERRYYFIIRFNEPFYKAELLPKKPREAAPRYLLSFRLPGNTLMAKVALSTVDEHGAENNMQSELPGWDFEATVAATRRKWNSYLSRIEIDAPLKQMQVFYTCMYRLFLQPSNIADADGRYRGADDSIAIAENREYYSTLSLWDTYRAAHPLYSLVAPEKVNGFIRTMLAHSKAAGFLPIWTAWGKDNYCMIGNHAIPVIADAYAKGFNGFDPNDALQQMVHTTTVNHINSNWRLLQQYGYYPFDSLDNESVSRTLEHGVDDYCISLVARKMGNNKLAEHYYQRSMFYRNLFDPVTRFFRGKDSKGHWRTPFNPLAATSPMNNPGDYTEANAWQYFWTPAQYDVPGMMQLLGGEQGFRQKLDSFFSVPALNPNKHLGQEAMIGQYAHGNEPSHHIAYLYGYTSTPDKGRAIITDIYTRFYNNTPDGMIGNDDCGQMSAWYVFSTLGFYPVNPADGNFVVGMPQVPKAILNLPNKRLEITHTKSQFLSIDGKAINGNALSYNQLIK